MHTALTLQIAVSHIALDRHQTGFDPGFIRFLIADDLETIAVVLGIALIHPEQHLRPVLRLGATGTWMDFQQGVGMIIIVGQKDLDLKILKFLVHILVFIFQQFKKFGIVISVELIQFSEYPLDVRLILKISGLQILQLIVFFDDILSLLLVRPESLGILQLFQLF